MNSASIKVCEVSSEGDDWSILSSVSQVLRGDPPRLPKSEHAWWSDVVCHCREAHVAALKIFFAALDFQ